MSLPIAPSSGPPRPPTHTPYDLQRLISLAGELEDALQSAGVERLSVDAVEDIAADLGAAEAQVWAAAAMLTEIPCDSSAPVRFEVCLGGCQSYGAGELLDHLLKRHAQRRDDGGAFGVVVKRCLDKCDRGAFVLLHTPSGTAAFPEATCAVLDEALAQLDAG